MVGDAASAFRALPVAERACAYKNANGCAIPADASRIEAHRDVVGATQRLRAACDSGAPPASMVNAAGDSAAHPESVIRAYGAACSGDSSLGQRLACTRVVVLALARSTTVGGGARPDVTPGERVRALGR